ncbi:hypothetical protein GEMRC1_013703 [Eukaryota sp. GEM-RC1]
MAYILDAMGSPATAMLVITSWIGFELALVKNEIDHYDIDADAFMMFIKSIPYSFYPLVAMLFLFINVSMKRDFEPMASVETAFRLGKSEDDKETDSDAGDSEDPALIPDPDKPHLARNAVIPIVLTISLVILFIVLGGRHEIQSKMSHLKLDIRVAKLRHEDERVKQLQERLKALNFDLSAVFSAADPYLALLYGISLGVVSCFVLMMGIGISFGKCVDAFLAGFKDISTSLLILWAAWSFGAAIEDLATAQWLSSLIPENFPPVLLISSIYIISCIVSFSCGSTWGAFVILVPLNFALVHGAYPGNVDLLVIGLGAVWSGSLFGNNASPLADTTIIASVAAKADLMDHVNTQLPYCCMHMLTSLVFGYLPTMLLKVNPWFCLVFMLVFSALMLRLFGKKVPVYSLKKTPLGKGFSNLEDGLLIINSE